MSGSQLRTCSRPTSVAPSTEERRVLASHEADVLVVERLGPHHRQTLGEAQQIQHRRLRSGTPERHLGNVVAVILEAGGHRLASGGLGQHLREHGQPGLEVLERAVLDPQHRQVGVLQGLDDLITLARPLHHDVRIQLEDALDVGREGLAGDVVLDVEHAREVGGQHAVARGGPGEVVHPDQVLDALVHRDDDGCGGKGDGHDAPRGSVQAQHRTALVGHLHPARGRLVRRLPTGREQGGPAQCDGSLHQGSAGQCLRRGVHRWSFGQVPRRAAGPLCRFPSLTMRRCRAVKSRR